MTRRTRTALPLFLTALGLTGCDGQALPRPSGVAPVLQPSYRLSTGPSPVAPGDELRVTWAARPGGTKDRIGLFTLEAAPCDHVWSAYTSGAEAGTLLIGAPSAPGRYEFRYLPNDGCDVAARSSPVIVSIYTLTPSPTAASPGAEVRLSWTASVGGLRDWIGLFSVQDTGCNHGWWAYTDGATSGTFTINAPTLPGQYEFRYYLDDGCEIPVRISPLTVGTGG